MDLQAVWVCAPILGAVLTHGPVLRFDLFPALKRPLDFGRTFRGRRIFGDNKTWRGALAIILGAILGAVLLSYWPEYVSALPVELQRTHPLLFGALLGVGFVIGELPNSFLKRQLDIAPGTQQRSIGGVLLTLYDQGDFVFGVWLCLLPIWVMTPLEALVVFAVSVVVHMAVNIAGFATGARKSWR